MSNKNTNEEIADAKAGAVVAAETTAVSAEVAVQGVQLDFPFIRLAQGMSQWKSNGKAPVKGDFYIGRNKDSNVRIADGGKSGGIYGIILQKVDGFKAEKKYDPSDKTPPRRWIIGGSKEDGTAATEADCLEAAAAEGYSLAPRPTGDVWPDSGRPVMRANLGRFCYLCMLIQLPDDFDSDDFRLYKIGDKLYTTARYEFDKQYFRQMDGIIANIRSRAEFAHLNEWRVKLRSGKITKEEYDNEMKTWRFSLDGFVCHIYSSDATSRSGIEYVSPFFEKAIRDGKPWVYTDEESEDLTSFLMSVQGGTASLDEAGGDSEF